MILDLDFRLHAPSQPLSRALQLHLPPPLCRLLATFTTKPAGQLHVFGHNSDTLGMDGAQVGICTTPEGGVHIAGAALRTRHVAWTATDRASVRSGIDPPPGSSRACLHTAFIAFSVPFVCDGPLNVPLAHCAAPSPPWALARDMGLLVQGFSARSRCTTHRVWVVAYPPRSLLGHSALGATDRGRDPPLCLGPDSPADVCPAPSAPSQAHGRPSRPKW